MGLFCGIGEIIPVLFMKNGQAHWLAPTKAKNLLLRFRLQGGDKFFDLTDHLIGVAPFVVIPCKNF